MDDVLGDGVGRGRLGSKEQGDGSARQAAVENLKIFPDRVQGVHLLALILVQALDLDVVDRIRVDGDAHPLLNLLCQRRFVLLLDGVQPFQHRIVGEVGGQALQLHRILFPAVADQLGDKAGEGRIAEHQPPAEGDAVGLVVEPLRIELIKGRQLARL